MKKIGRIVLWMAALSTISACSAEEMAGRVAGSMPVPSVSVASEPPPAETPTKNPTPRPTVALDAAGMAAYESEEGAFTFKYPGGWILADNSTKELILEKTRNASDEMNGIPMLSDLQDHVIFLFIAEESDGSISNFSIAYMDATRKPSERELLLAAPKILEELAAYCHDFKPDHKGEMVKIGSRRFLEIAYSYTNNQNTIFSRHCLLHSGTHLYVATLTASAAYCDDYLKQMNEVLKSLQFTD